MRSCGRRGRLRAAALISLWRRSHLGHVGASEPAGATEVQGLMGSLGADTCLRLSAQGSAEGLAPAAPCAGERLAARLCLVGALC